MNIMQQMRKINNKSLQPPKITCGIYRQWVVSLLDWSLTERNRYVLTGLKE